MPQGPEEAIAVCCVCIHAKDRPAMEWKVIRRYQAVVAAETDRAVLEASGIEAHVVVDHAGGMLPSLTMLVEARLVVRVEDAVAAGDVLEGRSSG